MYFWRVDALTAQMRHGPLPQGDAFRYALAGALILAAAAGVPGFWNERTEPAHVVEWVGYWLGLLLVVIGTLSAYRANDGARGVDFAARYLALGWVLGIRVFVVAFIPGLIALLAIGVALATRAEDPAGNVDVFFTVGAVALGVAVEAAFYWRLTHHLRSAAVIQRTPLSEPTRSS